MADDDRVFTRSDIEILRAVSGVVESRSVDPRVLLQLTRVTGQSLARIADAQVTAAAERLEGQRGEETSFEGARAELLDRVEALAPQSVGDIHGILGRAALPSPTLQRGGSDATGRMKSLSRQKTGPWRGIRLRGVGPAQPAAALRQRMWRSRTELDRALDPDGF